MTAAPPMQINYLLREPDGKAFEVSIQPQPNNLLKIEAINNRFSAEVKPEELFLKYELLSSSIVIDKFRFYFFLCLGLGVVSVSSIFLVWTYFRRRRENKLMKIMKIER